MDTKTNAKIRVRLESFNHELLTSSCKKIIDILQNTSLNSIGVVSLPTHKRIYCVLRSPHVDKDSREHFEIRNHKRILEIYYDSEVSIFDLLSQADLPSGVFYRICLS
jgi:small subunit ribosomal protein S10